MEYQHGGDIYSQEVDLDFSANLNPFGLPEAVRRAAADSLGDCTVYPDSSSRKLTAALAAYHNYFLAKSRSLSYRKQTE